MCRVLLNKRMINKISARTWSGGQLSFFFGSQQRGINTNLMFSLIVSLGGVYNKLCFKKKTKIQEPLYVIGFWGVALASMCCTVVQGYLSIGSSWQIKPLPQFFKFGGRVSLSLFLCSIIITGWSSVRVNHVAWWRLNDPLSAPGLPGYYLAIPEKKKFM